MVVSSMKVIFVIGVFATIGYMLNNVFTIGLLSEIRGNYFRPDCAPAKILFGFQILLLLASTLLPALLVISGISKVNKV